MATTLFDAHVDLNKNQILNAVIQNLASAPGTPVEGQIYYDTTTHKPYFYYNSAWRSMDASASGSNYQVIRDNGTDRTGRGKTNFVNTTSIVLAATDDSGNDETEITATVQFGAVTGQTSYGASSGNGAASTSARSDHTHGTVSLTSATPSTQAIGDAAVVGTGNAPAREDHKHQMPSFGNVTAQTTFGASSGNGASSSIARNDHTHGTPTHDASAHSAIKISDLAAPTATVSFNSQVISNLGTPSAATDAATKGYVDTYVQGLDFKNSVRVASAVAGTLASSFQNGSTVDGQTLATGDRILIKDQASPAENGIYIVQASGAPTRDTDADTSGDISKGSLVFVEQGTANAGQLWVCTATGATPWVPNSSTSTWSMYFAATSTQAGAGLTATGNVFAVGASTGIVVNADNVAVDRSTNGGMVPLKYATNIGNGSDTSITVTHNLGTRDVSVTLFRNSGSYEQVICEVRHTDTNTVTLLFNTAPTSGQYRCVVMG